MATLFPLRLPVTWRGNRHAKQIIKCPDQSDDAGIDEGVIDRLRVPARFNDPSLAQSGEMLRQRRLAQADDLLQRRDRALAIVEFAQNQQAAAVGHDLQQIGYFLAATCQLLHLHGYYIRYF